MATEKLILDYVYEHEAQRTTQIFLTQPHNGGKLKDYTWAQALGEARRMASHLQSLGFERGARIALLSKNSAHFIMAELAIWMAGYTTVAIFPTESAETIAYVLGHSEASLLFVGKLDTWAQQAGAVPPGLPCIELPLGPGIRHALGPGNGCETWDTIVARSAPIAGQPARGIDDLAMINYTSGSTGTPKGVMHSFGSVTRGALGIYQYQEKQLGPDFNFRALSYLPLAHIFERAWLECAGLVRGSGRVFFTESLDTFMQDLQRARPTTFLSVPRLWLKFQHGVYAKMPPAKLDRLLDIPIVGKLVARKVLKGLGLDQVKLAGSGSAPIPAVLIDWYRRLGLNLMEGYAMTEDFAYSHTAVAGKCSPGYVGIPQPGVQVRISEEGEVLVQSPGAMVGYYQQPELNAQSFTADGFFHTGDLGEIASDGQLKLTGRKKELFKTGKGKYVAPAPIENRLNECPAIELSMVSGVGQQAAYGLVVLAEELRPQLASAAVRADVEATLKQLLADVNKYLPDYERLRMLVVSQTPWSIENGCLTPTMKIKRSRIEATVAHEVDAWFAKPGTVLWA